LPLPTSERIHSDAKKRADFILAEAWDN
jgi:hypothetical protein